MCTQRSLIYFVYFFWLVLLAGCHPFAPVKQQKIETYLFDNNGLNVAKGKFSGKVLLITDPSAAPGFDVNKMAYVQEPYRLNYFTRHRWVDTPADMLKPLIIEALQKTEHFKAVVATPFTGIADYRLDTTILMLQQNFMRSNSYVQWVVRNQLINNATQQVMAVKMFTITEKAPSNNPYGGVVAANHAAKAYLSQLAQFLITNT